MTPAEDRPRPPRPQRGAPEELPRGQREAGYERSDVSSRSVLYVAAAFFLVLLLSGGGMWLLLAYYREAMDQPQATVTRAREIVPPEPRLEVAPERSRAEIESEARALIEGYAWADREAGIARIPVEEAMRLLADEGWPDPFRPEELVPPRGAAGEREVPRAGADPLPVGAREEARP